MAIGRRVKRLIIQKPTEVQDTTGDPVETWSTFAERYGEIEPLTGEEIFAAQTPEALATHNITFRFLSGLTTKMRIMYLNRIFHIDRVENVHERNKEHIVRVIEEVE